MVNQVVKTDKLAPVVETLFHWREEDASCHCLLRIYRDEQKEEVIVVASGLHSNKSMEHDVSIDFEALALAVREQYPIYLNEANTQKVTWICHYGRFSQANTYENQTTPERWLRVTLPWPLPEHIEPWSAEWWVLRPNEVEELNTKIRLSPVADILEVLARDI
ncbi:hypothetical protein C1752_10471 [Acaryochloris thomasi RCC1774]|uniref:Uncharacterized protein n=1 Tax=Acaryochloris thomasi RCC1774 TaxID=1764569 RepID=A0A2W1JMV8_9CYAN|nr:hypothetical protein [Acaryochloris thomasi]PZD70621.1 hypothetical protein C1752_10471 [Acaryochloris thomasi RCC1774]